MSIKDGGPAYPQETDVMMQFTGMTLREYFAGQALNGMIDFSKSLDQESIMEIRPKLVAKRSYEIADAMIAERDKSNA